MTVISDNWLLILADALFNGACHWLLMRMLTRQKPRSYWLPIVLLYHMAISVANNLDWFSTFSAALSAVNFIAFFAMMRYIFGMRGKRLVVCYLEMEVCLIALALLSLLLLLPTPYATNEVRASDERLLASMVAYALATCVVAGCIVLGRRLPSWLKRHPALPYALRMLLTVVMVALSYYARTLLPGLMVAVGVDVERGAEALTLFTGITIIAAVLAISLIYQDIRTLRQIRRNETRAQKQKTIDELLTSMRGFRHNIANLLFGMEGAVAAGDATETKDYYRQMVEKCALVNSENVLALQNLGIAPLEALLLHKLDAAYQQEIPIYLYVEPRVTLRGLPKSDLCEIAGVLMDNALEAAKESPAPYVSLELRSLKEETELVVRNTFAGPVDPRAFADGSGKRGHEGVGVQSVRRLLARRPEAFLNYRVAGRYVEAQVLVG